MPISLEISISLIKLVNVVVLKVFAGNEFRDFAVAYFSRWALSRKAVSAMSLKGFDSYI